MMCSNKSSLLAVLMSAFLLLQLCSMSEAASSFDCCLGYTRHIRRAISHKHIVGFTKQRAGEGCDIDAIIFFTKRKLPVCADPKDTWVKDTVHNFTQRIMKM